jgi:hypothetical protein
MAITPFTPVSGGSPDRQFIATTNLTTTARDWPVSGSAGNYSVLSATNQAGYVIYTDGTNKTGAPVGKSVYVGHSFNSITILGLEADQFSLYKVSPKTTSAVADVFSRFTLGHTTITTSGNHSFPGTYLPVVDLLVVGAGGGGGYHGGGGGGGGGIVYLSKYPMNAVTPATIGAAGGNHDAGLGGSTTFGGLTVPGGGGGRHHNNGAGQSGANGGGCGGHHGNPGGGSGQTLTGLPYGFTYAGPYAGVYYGGYSGGGTTSGHNNSWHVRGGGGGGATGAGSSGGHNSGGNGGAGYTSPFSNVGSHTSPYNGYIFSAGGAGAQHGSSSHGSNGGTLGNYGHGGQGGTNGDGTGSGSGVIIYRSYS